MPFPFFTESLTPIYHAIFGAPKKDEDTPNQLRQESLPDKIAYFNQAWKDLQAADTKLAAAGVASLWFIKDILGGTPIFVLWIAGGTYLYHKLQRNEKFNQFRTRLEDLYNMYKSYIEPKLTLTEDAIKILECIAPFITDTESLIPSDFSNLSSKILFDKEKQSEMKFGSARSLLERWGDILATPPHNRQFVFINPAQNRSHSLGVFKRSTLSETVERTAKSYLYGKPS